MPLPLCWIVLPLLFVTPQSCELATTEVGKGCGLESTAIDPPLVALEDGRNEKPGPWVGDVEIGSRPENGGERAEGAAFQHHPGGRGMYGGFPTGRHYGGVNGVSAGRWFGSRRPRQSDTATLFDSLDENADGVLAEDEIREFVEEVGGSTLDDHSEISGGVSTVMGRLDTDSVEGIGLKELSSRIKSFESILTVEEAVDWVTHAVQLPQEVAEAFRSNSVSGYDLLEFLDYDGRGLHYDLGIKRSYRKRIVQAIEIRVLGLGEEPLPPKLHQPTYLGAGKARITWSTMDENALADGHENAATCDDHFVFDEEAQASDATCTSGTMVVRDGADSIGSAQGGRGRGDSFHTFPVHKYVLQRTCLGCQVTGSVGEGQGGGFGECNSSDGSWLTVHEANVVELPSSEMAFVDSGLAHGKIYAYRLKAWNRVGHSEASFARLTTPPVTHLWKKPWRIIVPWLSTVNSSTAPGPSPGEDRSDDFGIDIQGVIWACVVEGMGAAWFVLSWGWWLLRHSLSAVNTFVVLVGISANLMRLAAAYGEGGTGSRSRRNWPAVLMLKLTDLITRNRFVCNLTEEINVRLERLLGTPSAPPTRGITRQHSMRARTCSPQRSRDVSEASLGRDWSPRSDLGRQDPREDWMMMSRIDEEYAGVGVDFGWRPKVAYRSRRWSSSMENSADNHKADISRYHTVSPSFTWKTDLSPTGQRLRWPRRVGARTPQRRISGRPEARSPPGFFGQGGDGSGISMESRRDVVPEQLTSSAESSLPIPASRHVEHSEEHPEERSVGVSRRRMLFRRGISRSSSLRVSRKEADGSERGPLEGEGRVEGRRVVGGGEDVCDDRVEGDLGEPPMPPGLLRTGSSDYRLTMHLRKSSVSRLALGLRKGEASGRDAWRKEFQEVQACFICHRRFHSLTTPRHQCGRCHRAFCRRDGYTTHPPLTRCSIPGTCVCDVCLQSETSGDRRGTVGDNTEGLGMRTFETETPAASDGVSNSSGRRLSWRSLGRWPSFGRHSRRRISTRDMASTDSADPLSSLAVSSVMASAAAATSSVSEDSTGTTSPSEESPATLPPHAPQRVSIDQARVGIRGGVIGVRESEIRRRVTR